MTHKILLLIIVFSCPFLSYGKQNEPLEQKNYSILEGKNATVGVAISGGKSQ